MKIRILEMDIKNNSGFVVTKYTGSSVEIPW